MSTPAAPLHGLTRVLRNLALGALLALLMLLVLWYGWLATPALSFWPALLVLFLLPLVYPLKGMAEGRPRAFLHGALIALLYFVHGVMEAYGAPGERWLALLEAALSLVLFAAALAYTRRRRRELTAAGAQGPPA